MTRPFLNIVEDYISQHGLLDKSQSYLVAFSGGADSTALLLALKQLGYRVEAAHCNFKLRGEESNRDESFCKEFCQKQEIPFHVVHFDTREYAALHKQSIELAARNLRYNYFFSLIKDLQFAAVCVAHHRDDNVETVLLNMARGTGLNGLCGIHSVNGRVVRPLLAVSRKDILDFLSDNNQPYVTDSTNFEEDANRNKIRLSVVPKLEEVNAAAVQNIDRMTRHLRSASELLSVTLSEAERRVSKTMDSGVEIDVDALLGEVSADYVLWHLLQPFGFSPEVVEQIYSALSTEQSGRVWQSATHELLYDRRKLIVAPISEVATVNMKLPETGLYALANGNRLRLSTEPFNGKASISKEPLRVSVDYNKVKFPLQVRNVQQGDRFAPFGMKGTKLVSDYLTDRKLSLFAKRQQLVVCDATGTIVWVVGERVSNQVAITSSTTEVLFINYLK